MIRYYYSIILLFICFSSNSQYQGYFGKRTTISIDGILKGNVFYNWGGEENIYNTGEKVGEEKGSHLISGGFNTSLAHYFSNRIGIAIDISFFKNTIKTPIQSYNEYYNPSQGYYYDELFTVEKMKMNTLHIIPKIEFASSGNLPIGIIHSFGIGYSKSTLVDQGYKKISTIENLGSYPPSITPGTYYSTYRPTNLKDLHGLVLEYGVKLKLPITSFMAFNIGTNVRLNIPFPDRIFDILDGGGYGFEGEIAKSMTRTRARNILDVRAGLTFMLF